MTENYQELKCQDKHKDAVLYFLNSPLKAMFKAEEFLSVLIEAFRNTDYHELRILLNQRGGVPGTSEEFFNTGVECEILEPAGKGWRKGKLKIKVTLEFSPDAPEDLEADGCNGSVESPLDGIRQILSQEK